MYVSNGREKTICHKESQGLLTEIVELVLVELVDFLFSSKGGFRWYNFVACDRLSTSLGHKFFHVNQTYNLLTIVMYNMKNVVGF